MAWLLVNALDMVEEGSLQRVLYGKGNAIGDQVIDGIIAKLAARQGVERPEDGVQKVVHEGCRVIEDSEFTMVGFAKLNDVKFAMEPAPILYSTDFFRLYIVTILNSKEYIRFCICWLLIWWQRSSRFQTTCLLAAGNGLTHCRVDEPFRWLFSDPNRPRC